MQLLHNKIVVNNEEVGSSSDSEISMVGDAFTKARSKKHDTRKKQKEKKQLACTNENVGIMDTSAHNLRSKENPKENQ